MIKRLIPWLAIVLIATAGFLWWRRSQASTATAVVFRTAAVQRGDVTQLVTGSGSLSAITTVEVGSQVSGNISKLYVDYNDTVKAGQLIAEIEPSTYQAKLVQAESDLLSTQATLELKKLNAKRSAELLAKSLVARSDYDTAIAELHQQEAVAKKSEAAVNSARLDVERCKITSPINGVVLSRAIDVGQTVQASFSAPTLFTLAQDLRQMQITANISEADIGGVEAGQTVSFTVDAFTGRAFQGKVREVRNNSTTSNNVVTYPTIITADNEDLKLRPGMTANVTITISRRAGVLRIANAALRFQPPAGATVTQAATTAGADATPGSVERTGPSLDDMPAEIRQRMLADFDKNGDGKLDEDETKTMREQMRARFASGGGPGGDGPPMGGAMGAPRARPATRAAVQNRTLYIVTGTADASGRAIGGLTATPVRVGLSDSAYTEILSGASEGALIATGTTTAKPATATTTTGTNNPFAPKAPAGGPPR